MKKYSIILTLCFIFFCISSIASAHVVVNPKEVGIGAFELFSVGVPSEKNLPTTALRLIIPQGLEYVTPNVKPGWKVKVITVATTTEIEWIDGSLPAGLRDDFIFSTKVPSQPTTLQWKAYQTYADGSVVSWDHNPSDQPKDIKGNNDFSQMGPYSTTRVIDDLSAVPPSKTNSSLHTVSIIALVFSIIAMILVRKNR